MIKLLPHQEEDSGRMAAEGDLPNWSKPGTGKTFTTLAAFEKAEHRYGVVICPPIALMTWVRGFQDRLGITPKLLKGTSRLIGDERVIVTSYGVAAGSAGSSKLGQWINSRPTTDTRALILDEAHYLRNCEAKRSQAIWGPRTDGRGLLQNFDQCWSLTGSPIMRYADDLWAQLVCLYPDLLASYGVKSRMDFVRKFCWTEKKQHHPRMRPVWTVVGSRNREELRAMLDMISPPRRELSDMPALTISELTLVDDSELNRLTKNAEQVKDLAPDAWTSDMALIKMWRELSVAKVKPSLDYIKEAAQQSPVLIGHIFRDVGDALYMGLTKGTSLRVAMVNGDTPYARRETIRDQFNGGDLDVIIGQMDALREAWDLQGGNHVIIVCDHFSPELVRQFYSRVYRMGQTRHCRVDFIKTEHPIDKALTSVRDRKSREIEELIK